MYWKTFLTMHSALRPKLAAAFRLSVVVGLVGLLVLLLSTALPLHAATIQVNTTADDVIVNGNCTLREAIIAANTDTTVDGCNAGNGFDTVNLPAGNYELSLAGSGEDMAQTGDLDITEGFYLNGAGRLSTIIDANGLDRVFEVFAGNVDINAVTITGGHSGSASGGGIFVGDGSLTLINSLVANNTTGGGTFHGGGIYFSGDTLTLSVMRIEDNTATGVGGGLYVDYNAEWTMGNSRLENNTAGGDGGVTSHGVATIRNSLISGNTATASTSGGGG
jgi:CSLREA domain-containing protein